MGFLKHPATLGLGLHLLRDSAGEASPGDEGAEVAAAAKGVSNVSKGSAANSTGLFGLTTNQIAISAVAPSIFGALIGAMPAMRAYAESKGISTEDATTNDQGGGMSDYLDFLATAEGGTTGLTFTAEGDPTKRVDNADNYLTRERLADLVNRMGKTRSVSDEGGVRQDFQVGQWGEQDEAFIQSLGESVKGGLGALQERLIGMLNDQSFAPVSLVDRNFGTNAELNRFLGDRFNFGGDFGQDSSYKFADFTADNGIATGDVHSAIKDFYGSNPDIAVADQFRGLLGLPPADQDPSNPAFDPFGGSGTRIGGPDLDRGRLPGGQPVAPDPVIQFPGGPTAGLDLSSLFGSLSDAMSQFSFDLPDLDALKDPTVVRGNQKSTVDRTGQDALTNPLNPDLLRTSRRRSPFDATGGGLIF